MSHFTFKRQGTSPTILSIWSATPSHHFLISLLKIFFFSTVVSASGFGPDLVGGGLGFSVPRVICNRGTLNSNISSMRDNEKDICPNDVEKWRTILNREGEREVEIPGDGVV